MQSRKDNGGKEGEELFKIPGQTSKFPLSLVESPPSGAHPSSLLS